MASVGGTFRLWGETPYSRLVGDAGTARGQLDRLRSSSSNASIGTAFGPGAVGLVRGTRRSGELVRGSNAFAFDLYHALKDGDGNLFYFYKA